jgi:DNA-binding response OmpR family regulator
VFISGYGGDAALRGQVALRNGDNFAQKPFTAEELLALIRRHLEITQLKK